MAKKEQDKKTGGGALGFLRESAIVVIGALIASTLLRMFLVQVFVIPSGSMENTLLIGDRIAVQKVVPYSRGDIVVFTDDNGWLPPPSSVGSSWWRSGLTFAGLLPDESSNHLVKRLIGLPGDHVKCCDTLGRVTVNGKALDEASYLYKDASGAQVTPSDYVFDVIVPEGRAFVMGDHRDDSADSRCHLAQSNNGVLGGLAFIKKESIVGTGAVIVFPFDRWSAPSRPATFADVPAATGDAPAEPVITGTPPVCT